MPLVTTTGMFTALVEEMADSPSHGPAQAWCDTVWHLFAVVYQSVPARAEELPADRKRYPTLNTAEASLLLGLFEQVYVKSRGSFSDWKQMAAAITRELFTTKWAFKEIVRCFASKHTWAHSPVLSQWSQVVRSGKADPSPDPPRVSSRTPRFEDAIFDPSVFSGETSPGFERSVEHPGLPLDSIK